MWNGGCAIRRRGKKVRKRGASATAVPCHRLVSLIGPRLRGKEAHTTEERQGQQVWLVQKVKAHMFEIPHTPAILPTAHLIGLDLQSTHRSTLQKSALITASHSGLSPSSSGDSCTAAAATPSGAATTPRAPPPA